MAIEKNELHEIISQVFPNAKINITDLVGDQDHYRIEIIDKIFSKKTKIEQHRIVHNALRDLLKQRLHAIELKTSDI
jgi:stress-induced morphogen